MHLGNFQKNLPPSKLKMLPHSLQIDRHDGNLGFIENFHHAGAKRLHLAAAGEPPFGKDAHQFAVVDFARAVRKAVITILGLAGLIGITPKTSASHLSQRFSILLDKATMRIGRELPSTEQIPSTQVIWLGTSSAFPSRGKFSRPTIRMR